MCKRVENEKEHTKCVKGSKMKKNTQKVIETTGADEERAGGHTPANYKTQRIQSPREYEKLEKSEGVTGTKLKPATE